jgi:cell division septation protein DedD
MNFRMAVALVLGLLLAGCAAGPDEYRMAPQTVDYAMAADPAIEAQPMQVEAPQPVQNAAPPQGKFAVQVAAPTSVEAARALIDSLRAKYPNDLAQQWAAILPVTLPKGIFYRVVIGPMPSEQQASQLCSKLRSQGTDCFIRRT